MCRPRCRASSVEDPHGCCHHCVGRQCFASLQGHCLRSSAKCSRSCCGRRGPAADEPTTTPPPPGIFVLTCRECNAKAAVIEVAAKDCSSWEYAVLHLQGTALRGMARCHSLKQHLWNETKSAGAVMAEVATAEAAPSALAIGGEQGPEPA
jgi:hypothetical protein